MRPCLLGLCVGLSMVAGCGMGSSRTATSAAAEHRGSTLSVEKIAWARTLRAALDVMDSNTAIAPSAKVDRAALYTQLEKELFAGPETPAALVGALRKAELAYPSGHLAFTLDDDNTCWSSPDIGIVSSSRLGVCTQPFEDHAVVSAAFEGGLLRAGDEILSVDGRRSAEMMKAALEQPMCTSSSASASNRRFTAGTSLLALPKPDMTIEVRHVDGTMETRTVSASDLKPLRYCRDPFGADTRYVARASRRGDVGIIRVPAFHTPERKGETFEHAQERLRAELLSAFEQVKHSKAIVWDLRANSGGTTPFGLEIVAGFPGVRPLAVAGSYRARIAGTNKFSRLHTFRLPARGAFAFDGKVAILVDGLSMSAADYTARVAKSASNAILLGAPAAGAYGGGTGSVMVGTSPRVRLQPDPYVGVSEDGERIIEGEGTEPTIAVELQPRDLARGVDTVLEAAIEAVR